MNERDTERFAGRRGLVGASVAVVIDGEDVVDLWGGWANADRTRPWDEHSTVCMMSVAKGVTGIVCGSDLMALGGRYRFLPPIFFFRPPDFCLGQHEEKKWTIPEWVEDQEAETYHRMTIRWAKLRRLFRNDPWGAEGPAGARANRAPRDVAGVLLEDQPGGKTLWRINPSGAVA